MLRIAALFLLLGVVATALPARAQTGSDAEAHALFAAGDVAYSEGRYAAALNYFRQAYEMSGRALLLYNIGSAAEHLRRDEEALEAFERYLAETPEDAPDRVAVSARIEILRTEIAEGASVPQTSEAPPPSAPPHDESPDLAPWIVLGAGGAVAIVGAILLGVGYADAATFQSAAPGSMWSLVASAHDRAPILEGTGFALLGIGVAAAVAGLIWGLTPRSTSTSASAWLDAQSGGLLLRGSL